MNAAIFICINIFFIFPVKIQWLACLADLFFILLTLRVIHILNARDVA